MGQRVTIVYKSLPSYRVPFYQGLKDALARDDIQLDLVYGDPHAVDATRADTAELEWGTFRPNRFVAVGRRHFIWQPIASDVAGTGLVIVEQASKLLINYPLLGLGRLGWGPPVALWGHGANLQRYSVSPSAERVKRFYSRLPHWWFAYTEGTRSLVERLGFPAKRITVVQNAVDTRGLQTELAAVTAAQVEALELDHDLSRGHTALYLGSLYPGRKLDYLIDAADSITAVDPAFTLLIAGDGPQRGMVERAAIGRRHVRYLGRLDGAPRSVVLAAADVLLMPGPVGLVILDGFTAGLPIVTTNCGSHGPEIEYLDPDVNGVMLPASARAEEYGAAVVELLRDTVRLNQMRESCEAAAGVFTMESMVDRFRQGIHQSFETPR